MTSLLESRAHHQRVRILSRKAQESEVHDQDPPSRRLHVAPPLLVSTNESTLTRRQRGQRRRRQREKNLRDPQESNTGHDEDSQETHSDIVVRRSSAMEVQQERGQRGRRQREKRLREELRLVSALSTISF